MICEVCKCEYSEDYRKPSSRRTPSRFCSRLCANARVRSEASKKKTSEAVKEAYRKSPELRERLRSAAFANWAQNRDKFVAAAKRNAKEQSQLRIDKFRAKCQAFLDAGGRDPLPFAWGPFRRFILDKLGHTCSKCSCGELWQGEKLVLHVDHKDGDSQNNSLENLQVLCPNCHSQTPTYGGRNRGNGTREYMITYRK